MKATPYTDAFGQVMDDVGTPTPRAQALIRNLGPDLFDLAISLEVTPFPPSFGDRAGAFLVGFVTAMIWMEDEQP